MTERFHEFHSEEFGKIEVLMIGGKPYFPASECARVLGYSNPRDAVRRHCTGDPILKRDGVSLTVNQHGTATQQMVEKGYISEGNLYRLIVRSKLPSALRFEQWVFDNLLPTMRHYGAYVSRDVLEEMQRSSDYTASLLRQLKEEQQKSLEHQSLSLELRTKALYTDLVLQTPNTIAVSLIAKEYGMTAAAFNSLLHSLGIQYRVSGVWVLYKEYADKGYTVTLTQYKDNKVAWMHTRWTQRGRHFLHAMLKDQGFLPLAERLSYDDVQQELH